MLGSKTYGQEGAETIDTRKELAFALRRRKDIIVLKMTDAYAAPYAVMQLPGLQSIEWPKGSELPEQVVEFILSVAQRDEAVVAKQQSTTRKHHASGGGSGVIAAAAAPAPRAKPDSFTPRRYSVVFE